MAQDVTKSATVNMFTWWILCSYEQEYKVSYVKLYSILYFVLRKNICKSQWILNTGYWYHLLCILKSVWCLLKRSAFTWLKEMQPSFQTLVKLHYEVLPKIHPKLSSLQSWPQALTDSERSCMKWGWCNKPSLLCSVGVYCLL